MKTLDTITVIGAGYVGVTTSAILASSGYKVYVIEVDKDRLQTLRAGRSFFYEEGLNPLIEKSVKDHTLIPTSSYAQAAGESSFIFSCVGTPDNPDGSPNLEYIYASAQETAKYIRPGSIYIQKSTVPVGTGRKLIKIFEGKGVDYVSNPEFLREGTALLDTLFFDRVVAGGNDKKALDRVLSLYRNVETHRDAIAKLAGIKGKDTKGTYIATGLDSSELIKVTANAFLALKISFANSIARLADRTEADIIEVMNAVGADPRIGRSFLNAGRGYGGGCLPKDVSGLISSSLDHNVEMPIIAAASALNDQMAEYILRKVNEAHGSLKGRKVAVLGLSFKAGTSDTKRSPGVKLANLLQSSGALVSAYDPQAADEAKKTLDKNISVKDSAREAYSDCEATFVTTDWPEFINLDYEDLSQKMAGRLVVDCMNCLDDSAVKSAGLTYAGVGRD